MKKVANYYLAFGFLAIAAVVIVLVASFWQRSSKSPVAQKVVPIADAKAQSYLAEKNPEVRETDRVFGSLKALVPIIVYEDYSNLYSATLADTLEKIWQEYGEQVAIIVRPYVSADSLLSEPSSLALDCAQAEGKWKEMRALLFTQVKNQQLQKESLGAYAKQLGLDEGKFLACLTNPQKSERIEQARVELKDYNILGAPTLFVIDEMVLGARPYEDYQDSSGDEIEGLKGLVERKLAEVRK